MHFLNIHLTGTASSIAWIVTWCGSKVLCQAHLFKFQEEISWKKIWSCCYGKQDTTHILKHGRQWWGKSKKSM